MTTAATSSHQASLTAEVRDWVARAEGRLAAGTLARADLDELKSLVAGPTRVRQRLLYLHTASPSPESLVMAVYRVDPVKDGGQNDLSPEPDFPYPCVLDAMIDGWQVVRFPEYNATIVQDREIDVQGYQFVLQKLEVYRD
jgi:hypothetical protein